MCIVIGVALFTAASIVGIKYGRHHFLPVNFAEVEAGRLYRAGYREARPLRRIIRRHNIRTIVTLLSDEPDSAAQQRHEAVAREEKVRIVRIPMPGDGRGRFEQLDQAADLMADAANHPMLVHCAAGANRTGAVFFAYRIKHCGWSFEKAVAEMETHGYSARRTPQLLSHLREYCERTTDRPG